MVGTTCVNDNAFLTKVTIKGAYVSLVINSSGVVGSGIGNTRCCASSFTHNTIFTFGSVVLCSLLSPFHHWLLYRSWFGSYLRTWQQHRALPPGTKWKAVLVTVMTFAVSLWLVKIWWVKGMLLLMLIVLLTFMLRMPVIDPSQQNGTEHCTSVAFGAGLHKFECFVRGGYPLLRP